MKWLLGLMLLAGPAVAQRAVMEGVAASRYTIKVDTTNARVLVDTTSYTGGISNVGLFVASNVVVGTLVDKNACIIYSSGSIRCRSVTATYGITAATITATSSVTASAFFGDGSHLTGISGGAGGHGISTGSLAAGGTNYPTQPALVYDGAYFTGQNDATHNATFISLSTSATSPGQELITHNCTGSTDCIATCSADKIVTGGGCITTSAVLQNRPSNKTAWFCRSSAVEAISAYAICVSSYGFSAGPGLSSTNTWTAPQTFTAGITAATGTFTTALTVSSLTVNGYNALGAWYSFTPSLSGSGSMTVSAGTVTTAKYQVMGKTMCLNIFVHSITIGGTPSTDVNMTLPGGKTADGTGMWAARIQDNSTYQTGSFNTQNTSVVWWNKNDGSNWTAGAGTRITVNSCFPIQ